MPCISPLYVRKLRQSVPCGQCNFCLSARRADWSFRLKQQLKISSSAFFITLTYDDAHENKVYDVETREAISSVEPYHIQTFLKRLRKHDKKVVGSQPLRYYAVGEYGTESERAHYHLILFNLRLQTAQELHSIWEQGNVHVGNCEPASIHYTTKYCITGHRDDGRRSRAFARMSKGLGENYLKNAKAHKGSDRQFIRNADGVQRIPRYIKNKIWPAKKTLYNPWTLRPEITYPVNVRVRERLSRSMREKIAELERLELERLAVVHPDPASYLHERMRHAHDTMTQKLSKSKQPI